MFLQIRSQDILTNFLRIWSSFKLETGKRKPYDKKSDPSKPTKYRPASLFSCIGKLKEGCVHKYLYNFAIDNNYRSSAQFGYINGDVSANQLVCFYGRRKGSKG